MTSVTWYDNNASSLASRYESLRSDEVHGVLAKLLPAIDVGTALDVGAGSGRDAAWLARQGFEVWAVEPSKGLRDEGHRRHESLGIQWLEDSLPDLRQVTAKGRRFNLILLSAVWMHIPPNKRHPSLERLLSLLTPSGILAITIRIGPAERERDLYRIDLSEFKDQIEAKGASIIAESVSADSLERSEIRWFEAAIKRQ